MAIPENYIDRITDIENGDRRYICPAADKVRVDNDNFEGSDLEEVLDEIADAIDDAGSGGYAPPAGGIPKTDLSSDVQTSLGKADTAYQKPASGIPATDIASGVIPDVSGLATKTELQQGLAGKVDKVTGYGLSKNDYTDADKAAVGTIGSKANDNVVVKSISVNGGEAQTPTQGNVNINVQAGSQIDPAASSPSMDGPAAVVGTSTRYAREDHVHPHDTSKQDALTFDNAPTANSNNMVKSGGIYTALQNLLSNITIGANGNWFVGSTDTNIKAQGPKGNSVADGDTFDIVNNLTDGGEEDALSAEMGKELAGKSYSSSSLGGGQQEVTHQRAISYFSNSFVRGQRQANTSGGGKSFGTVGSSSTRITTSAVFLKEDFGDTVKVFVPAGFFMGVRQANSLTETDTTAAGYYDISEGGNVMVDGGENGVLHTFSLSRTYWCFWAKYGSSDATITDQMIADLTAGCYIQQTEIVDTSEPVIEIVGTNGIEKRIYNNAGATKTTLYTKEATDALIGNASRPIRILQYNIGHFSKGLQAGTNITSANYDEMLARWKSMIKNVDADIIGMPEYEATFGNNGSTNVLTADSGIFTGYNLSVGASAASGWWMNALASRFAMTGAGDKDLGSANGVPQAYARYATVTINGKSVLIAATHLNWAKTSAHVASRATEIQNLIKWLAKYEYVILMGDFNTDGSVVQSAEKTEADFMAGASEFDAFKYYNFNEVVDGVSGHYEGGFVLANHGWFGDFKTADATGSRPDHVTDSTHGHEWYNQPFCCLDNIIVKGFRMSNVQVIDDGVLTDHCGLVCDLTMIEEGGES